jgi:hypothetical protein
MAYIRREVKRATADRNFSQQSSAVVFADASFSSDVSISSTAEREHAHIDKLFVFGYGQLTQPFISKAATNILDHETHVVPLQSFRSRACLLRLITPWSAKSS